MTNTIKVIDLLNKIANGEEVPEKIKYENNCYLFKHTNYSIDHLYELIEGYDKTYIGWLEHKDIFLFDTVEIIEEQEKIDIQRNKKIRKI